MSRRRRETSNADCNVDPRDRRIHLHDHVSRRQVPPLGACNPFVHRSGPDRTGDPDQVKRRT